MKIRVKITGSLIVMIGAVFCILAAIQSISGKRLRNHGDDMLNELNGKIEENVKTQLLTLAGEISRYLTTVEAEIDKNMLNAAKLLAEADDMSGGRLTLADLRRLRQVTGMSDLYLGNMNGVFTLSTEPGAAGISLFDIWDGYRMLATGESDYLPSAVKMKVETGEIFKFTAIPRYRGRGILESALNAEEVERCLQDYISNNTAIRSVNMFDYTFLTLTANVTAGQSPVFIKGKTVETGAKGYNEIKNLLEDPSKINLTLDKKSAGLYYPVLTDGQVRYVLYLDIDTSGYFEAEQLLNEPLSNLLRESARLNMISFTAVIVLLILFAGFIFIIIARMLEPIGFFTKLLASFAEGDFTVTVPARFVKKNDETGAMAKSFSNANEKMRALIKVIGEQTVSLSGIGGELASNMTKTAASVNQITANIKNMQNRTTDQAAGVIETSGAMEHIMRSLDSLNDTISKQAGSVSQSSSAIEEMLANIHSVVETLVKNTANVNALTESSEVGRADIQTVSSDIQEIARESEGLLEINAVMENISSQTNLLSMNAAIEAAHAGESGKGFAVVAEEIRKLAESAADQSKTTTDVLKKIKASIDTITNSTAVVLERFEAIDNEIKTVSAQDQLIRSAMEGQENGSKQILEAINRLNEITDMVKRESEDMAQRGREVISGANNVEKITKEIAAGMTEMAAGADQINAAVVRVTEISGENRQNIVTLSGEVNKFKV
jgi:methyl-accepting chemotaxis protein